MKNGAGDLLTVCPFYKNEEKNRINCEGISKNSVIQQNFNRKDEKKMFQEMYCFKFAFTKCPIYKMLKEKY